MFTRISTFASIFVISGLLMEAPQSRAASAEGSVEPVMFHCSGQGLQYQLSFTPEANSAQQKIQYLDGYSSDEFHQVEDFNLDTATISYVKRGQSFEISRQDGAVKRNGEPVDVVCNESDIDLIAQAQAFVDRATTTTDEFWTPTTGYYDGTYVQLGMLATSDEICGVFDHPFFSHTSDEYYLLDTINSDFRWGGIEAASLWIQRMFDKQGVRLGRFGLMENIHSGANRNLSNCLMSREEIEPGFYSRFRRHFLQNLPSEPCFDVRYEMHRSVNDAGELIETPVAVGTSNCVDFNYNSGYLGDWNTSTLTLMLIWSEAHPVLLRLLDQGELELSALIDEQNRIAAAEAEAEAERQRQLNLEREAQAARQKELEQRWYEYQIRQKSLMEQVYNFSTTGYPEGLEGEYWVEIDHCVLSNGQRTVDNRMLNMTAFRMYPELIGDTWYVISSDMTTSFRTYENIPLERLQNAWGLAFEQCPGQTSAF